MKPPRRSTRVQPPKPRADTELVVSLALFEAPFTPPAVNSNPETHQDLAIDVLNSEAVKLCHAYPNVTDFELKASAFNYELLVALLKPWKRKLVRLALNFKHSTVPFDLTTTLSGWRDFLNDLPVLTPSLKHLLVEDGNLIAYVQANVPAYIKDVDSYPNFPKRLRLETLYFGLPLAHLSKAADQLNKAQWRQLSKFAVFNPSTTDSAKLLPPFTLNGAAAARLTHYSMEMEMFFESSPYSSSITSHNFTSLTHFQVKTALPLEQLLTRFGLANLPQLEYFSVDSEMGANPLPKFNKRKTPDDEESTEKSPIFSRLNILELISPPHGSFALTQKTFPALKEVQLKLGNDDIVALCAKCQVKGNVADCHRVFYQSFAGWMGVAVYYEDELVKRC